MALYIIRHAHAVEAEEDLARPLSKRGRRQVRELAAFLRKTEALDVPEVWHSPLVRSRETAELLVKHLRIEARLVEVEGISVEDNPAVVAERLNARTESLAVVGHEPHLSGLLSLLIAGRAEPARFLVKKCAAIALERIEGVWAVRWQVSPEILGD